MKCDINTSLPSLSIFFPPPTLDCNCLDSNLSSSAKTLALPFAQNIQLSLRRYLAEQWHENFGWKIRKFHFSTHTTELTVKVFSLFAQFVVCMRINSAAVSAVAIVSFAAYIEVVVDSVSLVENLHFAFPNPTKLCWLLLCIRCVDTLSLPQIKANSKCLSLMSVKEPFLHVQATRTLTPTLEQ